MDKQKQNTCASGCRRWYRWTSRATVGLSMVALLALAGCPRGGNKGKIASIALEDVNVAMLRANCQAFISCPDDDPSFIAMFGGDVDTCVDYLESWSGATMGGLITAVNEGRVSYDAQQAGACLDALTALSCAERYEVDMETLLACQEVFTGTMETGTECMLDEECRDGYCDMDQACPGACRPYITEGQACQSYSGCGPGLSCQNGLCSPPPPPLGAGDNCWQQDREVDCGWGLFCNDSGVCEARAPLGGACQWYEECAAGLICDETDRCAELQPITVQGAACDSEGDGGGVHVCSLAAGLQCAYVYANDQESSTCEPLRQQGETCMEEDYQAGSYSYQECDALAGLYCEFSYGVPDAPSTALCQPRKADGASCEESMECLSGHCDWEAGQCAVEEPSCYDEEPVSPPSTGSGSDSGGR